MKLPPVESHGLLPRPDGAANIARPVENTGGVLRRSADLSPRQPGRRHQPCCNRKDLSIESMKALAMTAYPVSLG